MQEAAAVCPPADKKAKMEKVSDDFSLEFGLDAKVDTKPKTGDVSFIGVDKKLYLLFSSFL